ncbi:GT-D fold domain-containing glycosyltransferase [Paenibacillus sp. 1P07SE]|uniref:GT-D fold domain-containing protein n=1 Tax=Paenibacillus sp. 1P07SE TaxID=3132209 RepID=UPI0039A4B673
MQHARKRRPTRLRRAAGLAGKRKTAVRKASAAREEQWNQRLQEQAALSYNQGYDAGYDAALLQRPHAPVEELARQREEAHRRGLYEGGEEIVDTILPDEEMLPDIGVQQIIEAGIRALQPAKIHVLNAMEVTGRLSHAMDTGRPLSVIRLGDGELLTMAQGTVLSDEEVVKRGGFLPYAGVRLPDYAARDQLVDAIGKADIVGIPKLRLPNFQPLAFAVFRAHGIDYRQLQLTLSTVNYAIYLERYLPVLLRHRRVLVAGNAADGLAQALRGQGIQVTGTVTPVAGMQDIPRVMQAIAAHSFDIALVSAGIPAVVIVQQIATELGRTAIDFGHLADAFSKGEAVL